jgi:hypothetical protein
MPPFDLPVPKRYASDDPDNPDHAPEMRGDVVCIAEWGPDADRRTKLLIHQAMVGAIFDAYLQALTD